MNTASLPSIALEYREGSSDKVYRAEILQSGGGYVVHFAYGRRGSTLSTGAKTQQPVSREEATGIYTKLVRSKIAKGYRVVANAPVAGAGVGLVVPGAGREDTGLRPQLLNPVAEEELEPYLRDSDWCAQEKLDGRRMLLRKAGSHILASNRRGLLAACPQGVLERLASAPGPFVLDGELVGDKFHAFDLLESPDGELRDKSYAVRLAELTRLFGAYAGSSFDIVPTVHGASAKRAFVQGLKTSDREGAVFKDLRARWTEGRPASGGSAIKCKFWATCSCLVSGINNRRSIVVALDGRPVGSVTIPPNHRMPLVGRVVEVRYLYVSAPGGSLYQPVYLGERDDVSPLDCTFEKQQLKCKPQEDDARDLAAA